LTSPDFGAKLRYRYAELAVLGPMPDHITPERVPSAAESSTGAGSDKSLPHIADTGVSGSDSDLANLAALFATQGGGNLPAQLSADLALEIVLNEIVEQACLATAASGAAVALLRDGGMVCCASSGANAPELGARLDSDLGLTAECVATKRLQRCDDAQNDPRADIEASCSLGVRSVIVVPLLREGDLLGVLEVFSSQPGVFRERDEITLEALVQRILKTLEQARATITAKQSPTEPPLSPITLEESKDFPASVDSAAIDSASMDLPGVDPVRVELASFGPANIDLASNDLPPNHEQERDPPRDHKESGPSRFDVVTFSLSAAIVVAAVLFGTLVGVTLGWRKAATRELASKSGTGAAAPAHAVAKTVAIAGGMQARTPIAAADARPEKSAGSDSTGPGKSAIPGKTAEKKTVATVPAAPGNHAGESPLPAGGLAVYENGKEIFRMPPGSDNRGKASGLSEVAAPGTLQAASAREAAETVPLSPQTAEGSLVYRVEPEYPEEARQQNIQGPVVLDVHIGRDGAVEEVKLLSGQQLLADAAIAAVKQWRFKPRTWRGHPVEMQTKVTLNFRMPG
jgi:TonB family protein